MANGQKRTHACRIDKWWVGKYEGAFIRWFALLLDLLTPLNENIVAICSESKFIMHFSVYFVQRCYKKYTLRLKNYERKFRIPI